MQTTAQHDSGMLTIRHLNVSWVLIGYCFFIWFHLFPSVLLSGVLPSMYPFPRFPVILWYLSGIMLISGYIGFRSRGFTVMEPGISALLYLWTTVLLYIYIFKPLIVSRPIMMVGSFSVIVFVAACVGAVLGEYLQALGMKKQKTLVKSETLDVRREK